MISNEKLHVSEKKWDYERWSRECVTIIASYTQIHYIMHTPHTHI